MSFPPQFLEEIRSRVPVSAVVGRRVRLVKRGREHHGLCPFHNEKTPSFTVNDDKGFFHCFGCGAHGDVIGFVIRAEGLAFPEAVERLAGEAGLEVPQDSPQERQSAERRRGLVEAMEAACRFFQQHLQAPGGAEALAYLERRGLGSAGRAHWRLGYAPDQRQALKAALMAQGFTEAVLVEAGLLIRPEASGKEKGGQEKGGRETYDRFRGRVMFPITDRKGQVIAFGGRILGDGQPKYLNSPETPLFHKGNTLFGLFQAREAVRERGRVLVAEGYMDVIALHGAGFQEAVAPLGTALTEAQIEALWRMADEPVICLDGDAAGQRAALRAGQRALPILKPGKSLRFAALPAGLDPDELIEAQGPQAMAAVLAEAEALDAVLWRQLVAGRPLDTPERRAGLDHEITALTAEIKDPVVARHYAGMLRERMWQTLRPPRSGTPSGPGFRGRDGRPKGGTGRGGRERRFGPPPAPFEGAVLGAHLDGERVRREILLATLITHPQLLSEVEERFIALDLGSAELDKVRHEVLDLHRSNSGLDSALVERHLRERGFSAVLGALLSGRLFLHARFARVEASLAEARAGWEDAWRRLVSKDMAADLQDEERTFAADPTDANLGRLIAKKRDAAIHGDPGDLDLGLRDPGDRDPAVRDPGVLDPGGEGEGADGRSEHS